MAKRAPKRRASHTPELASPRPGGRVLVERDESARSAKNLRATLRRTVDPSWAQIEAAILRLDGRGFSDVLLTAGAGEAAVNFTASGGLDGRAICSVARPDDPAWGQVFAWLADDAAGDRPVTQVCGGQAGVFPAWMNVPRAIALAAARYFHAHATEDPALAWRRE